MKGILIVLDGLGDLPHRQLGDKTPLEAAAKPNLDFLANRGELGFMFPVKPGHVTDSDEGVLSIFGNTISRSVRGQLEAEGVDLKPIRGDLTLRANFATVDSFPKGNVVDRRVGRTLTTEEAEILAKDLNKITLPCKFVFQPTIQHRAVLILKGGFSENISTNDEQHKMYSDIYRIKMFEPLDEDDNSLYAATILNEFLEKAYEVLNHHPVNEERRKKGLMPANYILFRGPGVEHPHLKFYRNWAAMTYMPLEMGFAKVSGMDVYSFKYPKLKNHDVYANLYHGLEIACSEAISAIKKSQKKHDYLYIHIKETDIPGHDNKPIEKKMMIEYIDEYLFSFVKKFATTNKVKVVVTGDHSTPCRMKSHSADPVPVLFYNDSIPREKEFSEKGVRLGNLGRIMGSELLEKVEFTR